MMSTLGYSWNGQKILNNNTQQVKGEMTPIDSIILNIKNANAIYFYQLDKINELEEIVSLSLLNTQQVNSALKQCQVTRDSYMVINNNLLLEIDEKNLIINKKNLINYSMIGVTISVITFFLIK